MPQEQNYDKIQTEERPSFHFAKPLQVSKAVEGWHRDITYFYKNPSSFSYDNEPRFELEGPALTQEELARNNASLMLEEVNEMIKGNASAAEQVLKDVASMKKLGFLDMSIDNLEQRGVAKVVQSSDRKVDHIFIQSEGCSTIIDIDVKNNKLNGKSEAELKEDTVKQAQDFLAAKLAAPNLDKAAGKPLPPEVQAAAIKIMSSLMRGDIEAFTQSAQEVLKSQILARKVEQALDVAQFPSPIEFGIDDKGEPYLSTSLGTQETLIVRGGGVAQAFATNKYGDPELDKPKNIDQAMADASQQALSEGSEAIRAAQSFLKLLNRMPEDGYRNMVSLENEEANLQ